MMLTARLLFTAFAAVLGVASASAAMAQTFDVKTPEVDRGETEVEINASFFGGLPAHAERTRHSLELQISYGLTDWWKISPKINLDKPDDDGFRASTAGVDNIFLLRKPAGGFGLAWFTGLDIRLNRDETSDVIFGPVLQLGTDKLSVTLNPFLQRTFGANHTHGLDFTYAWQARLAMRDNLAVGIEGYGTIPDIGSSPGSDFQEHRIGPMLYLQHELGNASPGKARSMQLGVRDTRAAMPDEKVDGDTPKLALEIGVLFGLTEATHDVAFKLKGGIAW